MVLANDDLREIDRSVQVAWAAHHRRREQLDAWHVAAVDGAHVLQAAHDAQVGMPVVESLFALLPGDVVQHAHWCTRPRSEVSGQGAAKIDGVVRHQ